MKTTTLLIAICMATATPALSQEFQDVVPAETEEELDEICKTAYLGYMSTPAEIEEAVNGILKTVGIKSIDQANFTLKGCDKINNAIAKMLKDDMGNDVRYVLYDPQLLQNIIDKTNNVWSAKFILAHEIGHHMLGHSLNNGTSSHEYELAADYFAGRALAMMGATEMETTSATSILPERASSTHPSRKDRLAKAKEGWNSVERAKVIKVRDEDINDIGKNLVNRVTESLSSYSSLSAEDFQKNFQALTLARTKYYKAYTEDIRYLEALCLHGMGEQNQAETAYINYLSIEDLDNKDRIEQIVGLYLDSNTDKSSFFQNPNVLYEISHECFNRELYEKAINYGNQFYQFSDSEKDGNRISEINKLIANSEYEKIMLDDDDNTGGNTLERGYTAYENQEWDKAFPLLEQGAKAGDAKSEYYLGMLYMTGNGAPFDTAKGKILLLSSCGKGYGQAQYAVGGYYYYGSGGFSKDFVQAKYWLRKASESGIKGANDLLNSIKLSQNTNTTPTYYTKEEDNNTSDAEKLAVYIATGDSYFSGEMYADAYENFIKAAKMGDAYSQEKVAWMLYKGKGVGKDKDAAIEWWKKAAKQGDIESINTLTRLGEW